ncbi:hypothetical protein GCM10008955_35170 [Deinococcus malanensis]|uniref:Carboxyltransferase domain-containing protein n=1 Tax=Deinococcus malanensis TaxID=1706855 RepID=A0ABQ2F1D9_9DEIO|nr:biotin-dependent carboxyltransferase family protein [Deinococcus malanensis]GGK38279.1 hypothetical protein GCM10008955_35170 [Deinococcus malanensis]
MIEVLQPGLQSTLQDTGRQARALGVPAGGAADPVALRLAQALVGNPPDVAALEVTLQGPTLRFHTDALVALCGAPFEASLDGAPLPLWQAVWVGAGQTLSVGGTSRGLRAVLAVRGGLAGDEAFGSRSTDLRSGFGGLGGRALQRGDRLTLAGAVPPAVPPRAWVSPDLYTPVGPQQTLRVLATAEASPELLRSLVETELTVSSQVDRMGARLTQTFSAPHDPGRVSLPNVPGAVQLPPDGRPIVLLPDAGTHGGYPTPLVVARADLPRLGQLRPGDRLHFRLVDTVQARTALRDQEQALRLAEDALRWWYNRP